MTKSRREFGSEHEDDEVEASASDAKGQGQEPGTAGSHSGVFRASRGEQRISGGWTIAEQFVREGYCYRLLRRPVAASDDAPRLTKRELAALELASAGHGNKSIAQLLEVSPSTVGVLLFRAAAKLNVASRSDLLLAYQALKAAGSGEPAEPQD
ncbi:MAG: LuxR family transcriptional regulator [Myxococcales bacterium]|nr:MAG: LuxR family transcriptional regulator [Myxococcales bacterium]